MVKITYAWLALATLAAFILTWQWHAAGWLFLLFVPAWLLALDDSLQTEHTLRRNFPLISRARWVAEYLRTFVCQYFIESETDAALISRMFRSIVYQRAKRDDDTNSLEYSNSVGMPLREGLAFVDDCLRGCDLRNRVRVIASGKILTGFHLVKNLALGVDLCVTARAA